MSGDSPRLPELLAPAGTEAAFRCALAGGADAIYCGLAELNARRGAENFDDESLARCCRLAHLAGTRVYLTLNVAVKETELAGALELARRAASLGADALIIQDLGLLAAIRERCPELELHVSTQANVQDARGVAWCGRHGAARVTLSRELSLDEIRRCCEAGREAGAECEVFCHGALCMSYSGLCLMSSLRGNRSANRGLCAQPCRLPHQLLDGAGASLAPAGTRALCPKDLCALPDLEALCEAGVAALKIEGRMKAPDYVLSVTRAWRRSLDGLVMMEACGAHGQHAAGANMAGDGEAGAASGCLTLAEPLRDEAAHALKRAFNRDFTDGYLHGRSDVRMMSPERSNNRGSLVGEVAAAKGSWATVRLTEPVGEGDLLEFRPVENPDRFLTVESPEDAEAGADLRVRLKRPMGAGVPVRVLRERRALADAKAAASADYPRKRPVRASGTAIVGVPLRVRLETEALTPEERAACGAWIRAEAMGPVVEPARTRELAPDELERHVNRLGSSPFSADVIDVEVGDGAGLSFSTVHHVRARAVEALEQRILGCYEAGRHPWGKVSLTGREGSVLRGAQGAQGAEVMCLAASVEAAEAAREAGADGVYLQLPAEERGAFDGAALDAAGSGFAIPWLDEVCREVDHARIDPLVAEGGRCVVSNVSELALAVERGAAFEVGFDVPVFNTGTVRFLEGEGARGLWLPFELSGPELARVVASASVPCGVAVAGALRAMTTEHCVLQQAGRCTRECARCTVAAGHPTLENIDGRRLPVTSAPGRRSRIWWDDALDLTPFLDELQRLGIRRLLVDARLMAPDETAAEVRRVRAAIEGASAAPRRSRTTTAHYLDPVA